MSPIPFEPGAIRMLAKLMDETGLSEVELAEKDHRIRLVRAPAPATIHQYAPSAGPELSAAPPSVTAIASHPADHAGTVFSPMVGVAYLTPEPNAPPFITVGTRV